MKNLQEFDANTLRTWVQELQEHLVTFASQAGTKNKTLQYNIFTKEFHVTDRSLGENGLIYKGTDAEEATKAYKLI